MLRLQRPVANRECRGKRGRLVRGVTLARAHCRGRRRRGMQVAPAAAGIRQRRGIVISAWPRCSEVYFGASGGATQAEAPAR